MTTLYGAVSYFYRTSSEGNSVWTINHNLGAIPAVDISLSLNGIQEKAFPLSIAHPSVNQTVVTWSAPHRGQAVLIARAAEVPQPVQTYWFDTSPVTQGGTGGVTTQYGKVYTYINQLDIAIKTPLNFVLPIIFREFSFEQVKTLCTYIAYIVANPPYDAYGNLSPLYSIDTNGGGMFISPNVPAGFTGTVLSLIGILNGPTVTSQIPSIAVPDQVNADGTQYFETDPSYVAAFNQSVFELSSLFNELNGINEFITADIRATQIATELQQYNLGL